MKVGMYYNNNDVRLEEQAVPKVGPRDILIKVMASGICGSDILEWYRIKRAPLVLGHEISGEIVEAGKEISKFKIGDRVFATHHVPCNTCRYCLSGHETACEIFHKENNFKPGGFSQFLLVTGKSIDKGVFKLPGSITYDQGSFIEPLGTALRGLRAADLKPGSSLLVMGSGIAGLLIIKLAAVLGAGKIFAVDINPKRLKAAKKIGADFTIDAKENLKEIINDKNDGRLFDKVIISTGALSACKEALKYVDRGGTAVFFAVPRPGEEISIDFNPLWRDDISLKTCYGAAPLDNLQALEMLGNNRVNVDDMITHRFTLDKIQDAFITASNSIDALKVIVEPNR